MKKELCRIILKILDPPSNIANGAIFAFDENFEFLSLIPENYNDFCADIVPRLKGKFKHITQTLYLLILGPDS